MTRQLPEGGVLAVCGLVISACVLVWVRQGDQTGRVVPFLLLYGLAFTAYLAGLAGSRGLSPLGLRAALALALLWRLALAFTPPLLSSDVNRYVWEGRVQVHGGNPYAWEDRPDAPRWQGLRDSVYEGMNHPSYTAVYPPLWQMAAAAVVWVHDSITAMKLFLVACEVLALVSLGRLLQRRGQPPQRVLIWAWSPFALVEIAGSGHNEAFGLVFVVLALLSLEAERPFLAALCSALGFQAKFLPGLLALSWLRRFRAGHLLAAAALAGVLVWPYRGARRGMFLSLGKYAQFWRFNDTLFAPLSALLGHAGAVRVGAGVVLALTLVLAWRQIDPATAGFVVVSSVLLLGPNLLPWYALWLLPFLVLLDAPFALLFTGTVALAYLVYPAWQSGEPWYIPWRVRVLEYGPCALVLAMSGWRASSLAERRRRKPLTGRRVRS